MTTTQTTTLDYATYRKKVYGCWLGKAVGGTLGQPWEGKKPPYEMTFYDPAPDKMLGNDDLDLQIAWLQRVLQEGLPIDRRLLAGAWQDHIINWPDEYGICDRNLDQRLWPSLSGGYDNQSPNGMGAAIRSEIWACLAPGDPELAAHFAREDACCDHTGAGLDAAVFLATIESAAFVESDRDALIALGLKQIDPEGRLARGIRFVLDRYPQLNNREAMLAELLERFGTDNFTDVAVNLPIIVLAWLIGGDDFDTALLAAANCGQDTDCTCATLGSIFGLIDPDCIGERWLEPIGEELVLSEFMVAMNPPRTLGELTDQVADMTPQVLDYYGSAVVLADAPEMRQPLRRRMSAEAGRSISRPRPADPRLALVASDPIAVELRYPDAVRLAPGEGGEFALRLTNAMDRAVELEAKLIAPAGWAIERGGSPEPVTLGGGEVTTISFTAAPNDPIWRPHSSRLVIELRVNGVSLRYEAGLLMTIPAAWWSLGGDWPDAAPPMPGAASRVEASSHFLGLDGGTEGLAFCFDVKLPFNTPINLVAMCGRPVRLWWNEHLVVDHQGPHPIPPVYRVREASGKREIKRGEHRLTLAVAGGAEEGAGQLYWVIGLGERRAKPGRWYTEAEFAVPR